MKYILLALQQYQRHCPVDFVLKAKILIDTPRKLLFCVSMSAADITCRKVFINNKTRSKKKFEAAALTVLVPEEGRKAHRYLQEKKRSRIIARE
jgi:hypothetical protein